ncbi:hypothetical protein [Methanosarcina mazei]|uniref:hypothetical protein n=1 Tax=Methanosarcina mazei TaxID=2209 RepID=UPI0012D3A53A|nr:hypothetical protein [Methanosarcina mazei]
MTQVNETKVIAPENTPATISTVPYILPVFWIISLAEINPHLPAVVEVGLYTFLCILLQLPLWYRKSVVGKKEENKSSSFDCKMEKGAPYGLNL